MRKNMGLPKKWNQEKINRRVLTMGLKFDEGCNIYFHEMLYSFDLATVVVSHLTLHIIELPVDMH